MSRVVVVSAHNVTILSQRRPSYCFFFLLSCSRTFFRYRGYDL